MAQFNPPDSHWAADFDTRLVSTFHYLKDQIDALSLRVRELEAEKRLRDLQIEQAVADMKFYARQVRGDS